MTMALLPGGPAVGAADPRYCGATDQRGWVIAHDGDSGGCDIGAYELFRPPHDQTAPKIKGKHLPGVRLFCWRGTWSGATPMTFAYRWLRDGKTIAGATGSHYRVSAADRRHALRCAVTATNVVSSASAVSAAVRILASRT
jgi:hypothetical protein